jgi:hypothetical protein
MITNSKFAALMICTAVLSVLATAVPCAAQKECDNVSVGTSYKVLVDEVQYATTTGNQPALPIELIRVSVEGALEKIRKSIPNHSILQDSIKFLTCTGRHPQGPSDFDDTLVIKTMVGNHAILEFWGTLIPLGGGQQLFNIQYVMFPVASLTKPAPSGVASTQKTMATKPTPLQVTGYLVNARADLPAYFTVAAGVQAYADQKWDEAVGFLCEARTRLKGNPDQKDLMNYADQLAVKAATELRKKPDSGTSLMNTNQVQDYCGFATKRQ